MLVKKKLAMWRGKNKRDALWRETFLCDCVESFFLVEWSGFPVHES